MDGLNHSNSFNFHYKVKKKLQPECFGRARLASTRWWMVPKPYPAHLFRMVSATRQMPSWGTRARKAGCLKNRHKQDSKKTLDKHSTLIFSFFLIKKAECPHFQPTHLRVIRKTLQMSSTNKVLLPEGQHFFLIWWRLIFSALKYLSHLWSLRPLDNWITKLTESARTYF